MWNLEPKIITRLKLLLDMNRKIFPIPQSKYLGLIIDETLSWNEHIEQIATKLCSACYALRNLKHIVPQSTLRTLYYAYIHSILSYGIIFWGRSSDVNKFFILQLKIVRIITNSRVR